MPFIAGNGSTIHQLRLGGTVDLVSFSSSQKQKFVIHDYELVLSIWKDISSSGIQEAEG